MSALNTAQEQQESVPEIQRFPVQIDGKRAWLLVKNGQIESINYENGEKIILIDSSVDFMKDEQKSEGKGLYSMAKEILAEIEEKGVRPVFTVPREYATDLFQKGLEPRATWIKDGRLLAGTIAIPYYNKEGDRIICVVKNGVPLQNLSIKPRLTGTHPAVFQGVVATEAHISKSDLIFIDTADFQVLDYNPRSSNDNMLASAESAMENTNDPIESISTDTQKKIRGL